MRRTLTPAAPVRFLLGFVILLTAYVLPVLGQTGPEVLDVRPFTPLSGSSIESVSEINGSLNVNIPIWSLPQRGTVKLDFTLAYDSPTYIFNYDCTAGLGAQSATASAATSPTAPYTGPVPDAKGGYNTCQYPFCTADPEVFCQATWDLSVDDLVAWHFGLGEGMRVRTSTDVLVQLVPKVQSPSQTVLGWYWVVHTPEGGSHNMALTTSGDYRAVDGSGWEYQVSNCTARDSQGTRYVFTCTAETGTYAAVGYGPTWLQYVEDINGNRITLNYVSNPNGGAPLFNGWTDTLGRTVPALSESAPYAGQVGVNSECPAGSTSSGAWQPPDTTIPIVFCGANLSPSTDLFTTNSYYGYSPSVSSHYAEYSGSYSVLTGVILPSTQRWTFGYVPLPGDPYYGTATNFGELRQIGLPTGGTIHYVWNHTTSLCGVLPAYSMARSYITERDLAPTQGANPAKWYYSEKPQEYSATAVYGTTTDPLGNYKVVEGTSSFCGVYPATETYNDANNNVMSVVTTDYQSPVSGSNTVLQSLMYAQNGGLSSEGLLPVHKFQAWPDGKQKETVFTYDSGTSFVPVGGGSVSASVGKVTSVADYDYGTTGVGALLRTTSTGYWWQGNASALQNNILNPVSSSTVVDNVNGTTRLTTYGYDGFGLTSGNASVGWDSAPPNGNVRGNQTQVYVHNTSNSSILETDVGYTNTGQIAYITPPADSHISPASTTTFGYSSSYQGGFLTSRTDALGHTMEYTYYPSNYLLHTIKDDGNNTTTTYGYWPDNRLESVVYPALPAGTPETDYSYPSATQVNKSIKETGSSTIQTVTLYDGLGRPSSTQLLNGCGSDYIETNTSYDQAGNVYQVTNPHCHLTASASDGTVTHASPSGGPGYDGLGRPLVVTQQDGTTQQWSYADNTVTFTDEASNSWARTSDGLGRLTMVVEPGNLPTTYLYDAFGDLMNVTQTGNSANGEVPRMRAFTYNGLSQLVTAKNPETGLICYGTVPTGQVPTASNCTPGYDNHGNLMSKTDAMGVVVTSLYDSLNRVRSKTSSDGTVADVYTYDLTTSGQNEIGRLSKATSGSTTGTTYSYDPMGRVIGTTRMEPNSGGWQTGMTVATDLMGNPTSITYPDSRIVVQTFDAVGRLATVTSGGVTYLSGVSATGIAYWPSGAEMSYTLGNGLSQTDEINNRLQPCRTMVNSPLLATVTGGGNLLDRESFYHAGGTSNCGNEAGNNGNMWSIIDNLHTSWSQTFTYDALNRIKTGIRLDNGYSHNYNYDSFGNLTVQDNLHTNPTWGIDTASNEVLFNPTGQTDTCGHKTSTYVYNCAGNMTSSGPAGHAYAYNALSQLLSVDGGSTGSYTYNGMDERVNKAVGSAWTGYVYLNGQPMAEQTSTGVWTDYIYANGQKIAKVASQLPVFHMHGVRDGTTPNMVCGVIPTIPAISNAILNQTIKTGDKMVYDIRQTSTGSPLASAFAIALQSGQNVGGSTDVEGNVPSNRSVSATNWQHSVSDMSNFAGQVMTNVLAGIQGSPWTGYGTWDIWIANAAVVRADGSILPIFTGQSASVSGIGSTCGGNSQTFQTELTPVSDPNINTNYYVDDHLGTAQMETNVGGWPVWEGQFTPFGLELADGNTAMHYKFTGKERDAESGLDYFGARYYASSMGRWMSPDWVDKPEAVPYSSLEDPQTLNLYEYVGNNPLSVPDLDGHGWIRDFFTGVAKGARNIVSSASGGMATFGFVPKPSIAPATAPANTAEVVGEVTVEVVYTVATAAASEGAGALAEGESGAASVTQDFHAPGDVPNGQVIVRGGQSEMPSSGTYSGSQGATTQEAGQGVPHGTVREATAGDIRAAGGDVRPAPEPAYPGGPTNGQHVNVSGGQSAFGEAKPNPALKDSRLPSAPKPQKP